MLRWLTIVGTVGMVAVNGLANTLPIGGKTTGEISDGFEILYTPAGYVFSIWGLIYLGLAGFAVLQALPSWRSRPLLASIRPWYLLNTAANAGWILAWHHELFGLTLVLMLVILGSLIAINRSTGRVHPSDRVGYALIRVPFSLYLAWICIATIANITVVAWTAGATGPLSDAAVTLGIVVAATGLGVAVSLRRHDPVFAAVFVWAIVGIAVDNPDRPLLYVGAWACAIACAVAGGCACALAARRAA